MESGIKNVAALAYDYYCTKRYIAGPHLSKWGPGARCKLYLATYMFYDCM
jgi:hypothetical protein